MNLRKLCLLLLLATAGLLQSHPARALEIHDARVEPSRFSPNGDGIRDTARVIFDHPDTLDSITIQVFDAHGNLVVTRGLSSPDGIPPGADTLHWNGLDALGAPAPEGQYSLILGISRGAATAQVPLTVVLDVTPPQILNVHIASPFTPTVPGSPAADTLRFTVAGLDRTPVSGPGGNVILWAQGAGGPGNEKIDTVDYTVTAIRGDSADFQATFGDSASIDGLRTVYIDAYDAAGNHGGGGLWGLDIVTAGPAVGMRQPQDPPKLAETRDVYLSSVPTAISGFAVDRHPISSFSIQFNHLTPDTLPLAAGSGDTLLWSVPVPDTLRAEGTFTVTWNANDEFDLLSRDFRTYHVDTSAPGLPVLAPPPPPRVGREIVTFNVFSPGGDTTLIHLVRSDGSVIEKSHLTGNPPLDTLRLLPGANVVTVRTKDLAGNFSLPVVDTVFFKAGAGISAPELFRPGDAFLARASRIVSSFEVRIYRPDGGLVRTLTTSAPADATRENFELPWDLKNDAGVAAGRGPYFCFARIVYFDSSEETRRMAVVAMP